MQNESSTVITANVPRTLRDELAELARENFHSTAAEVRVALSKHLAAARARGETVQPPVAAVELASSAQTKVPA